MPFEDTLSDLITGRGSERFQSGLVRRFKTQRIGYSLTYYELTLKLAIRFDFETDDAIGRVTLWASGECDIEVLDATTGRDFLSEQHVFKTIEEFLRPIQKSRCV